jgi:hypothetical protein
VVVQVGDGTANVPNTGTQAVALSVLELSTAALPLAPGGLLINVASALSSAAYPYQLTALGEAADPGGANKPWTGKGTLSADGQYISLVGYNMVPGTAVGTGSMLSLQSASFPSPVLPAPAADRIIAVMNYAGQIVNAVSLSNQRTGMETTDIKGALWFNASGRAGFYVVGGWSNVSQGIGGLWWLPLASVSSQPAPASAVQIGYTATSATTNGVISQYKVLSDPQIYEGQLYDYKSYMPTISSSQLQQVGAGAPTTTQSSSFTSTIYTPAANNWDSRGFLFVPLSTGTVAGFTGDAGAGLNALACANTTLPGPLYPVTCGTLGSTAACCTLQYTTMIPGATSTTNYIVSIALATVAGVQSVVVTRTTGIWLWPVSNNGPYASSSGNCCGAVGSSCCWGNANTAAAVPAAGYMFRSATVAPQLPPCRAGQYGLPQSCLPCPANTWSAVGAGSCTACPTGAPYASSALTGQPGCACTAGNVWVSYLSACAPAPPCVAGLTWGVGGVYPCVPCTSTCGALRTVVSACSASADLVCSLCQPGYSSTTSGPQGSDCVACPANTFQSLPDRTTCSSCGTGLNYQLGTAIAQTQCLCQPPPVYWSNATGTCLLPVSCVAGSTWSASGNSPCSPCTPCAAGYEAKSTCSTTANAVCQICPAGFAAAAGSVSCGACPAGYFSVRFAPSMRRPSTRDACLR